MTDDVQLLRRYVDNGSDDAFSELVNRNLPLVYSTALRIVGDEATAKDVAQTVFIDLAHKARVVARQDVLAGWLYTSARFAACKPCAPINRN